MEKPREFWIDGFKFGPQESCSQDVMVHTISNAGFEKKIHVIEKSAIDRLERVLRQIQNSVAIASWSIKPEIVEWSKVMNQIINEALTDLSKSENE